MSWLQHKINNFCTWLTWTRLVNLVLLFLIFQLLLNVITSQHTLLADFMSLFFYVSGLICGIALTLSVDRRKANIFHNLGSRKKEP